MIAGTARAAGIGPTWYPFQTRKAMSVDSNENAAPLLVLRDGAVETLVINDAPRNRMRLEFMDALEAEVERLAEDSSVRAASYFER